MAFPALETILQLLKLEPVSKNIFIGQHPATAQERVSEERAFGGQLVAQAIAAANQTVDTKMLHSLHSYFLRPATSETPIRYTVTTLKDGKSFDARQITATQAGTVVFQAMTSYHEPETGPEHQIDQPSDLPDPETLPTFKERNIHLADFLGDWYHGPQPFDIRFVGEDPFSRVDKKLSPRQDIWIRANGELPRDEKLHQTMAAYISDITLLDTTTLPHGTPFFSGKVTMASIDHSMWFHRQLKADKWFLYSQDSPSTQDGRGYARGTIYQEGKLVVSMTQEGLIRKATV